MDKFPECFKRFKEDVNIDNIDSWRKLHSEFSSWAGSKWQDTSAQLTALGIEARKEGIQTRFGFSRQYSTFQSWSSSGAKGNSYRKRIASYMHRHPYATLAEARGHRRR